MTSWKQSPILALSPSSNQSAPKRRTSAHDGKHYKHCRIDGEQCTRSVLMSSPGSSSPPHRTLLATKPWSCALERRWRQLPKSWLAASSRWQADWNIWPMTQNCCWRRHARSVRSPPCKRRPASHSKNYSEQRQRCDPSAPSCELTRRRRLGMVTMGAALSFRVGEIRIQDLQPQIDLQSEDVEVLALTSEGVPVQVYLRLADKWAGTAWQRQLGCPDCHLPCRVLRFREGRFSCARCAPRATPHHRFKNTDHWQQGGRTTDAIIRQLIDGSSGRHARPFTALQRELVRDIMDRADAVLPLAVATLEVTDATSSESEHGPKSKRREPTPSPSKTETE